MTVLVELTAPAESVGMAHALETAPETVVDIERVVGHPAESLTPYLWAHGGDDDAFSDGLAADPTVAAHERLDVFAEETLYRAKWSPTLETIPATALENDATVLEAAGRNGEWELRLRFRTEKGASDFSEACSKQGLSYQVDRVYHPKEPNAGGDFGITPKQREAVRAALDAGYYEVPPETTMNEVAADLGISQQSLSRRLRRAHGNLVTNALTIPEPIPEP